MLRFSQFTFTTVFGLVYVGLMTNLLLVVGCLPFLVVLVMTDPGRPSVLLAACLPLVAPMVAAAFAVFRAYSTQGSTDVVRRFLAGLKATGVKSLGVGALATAALVLLALDAWAAVDTSFAIALLPMLAVLAAMVLAITMVCLTAIVDVPQVRFGRALAVSSVLAVRTWWLSLVSLVVIGTLLVLFVNLPALAAGLAAAPFLYGVWANCRYQLRAVLHVGQGAVAPEAVGVH